MRFTSAIEGSLKSWFRFPEGLSRRVKRETSQTEQFHHVVYICALEGCCVQIPSPQERSCLSISVFRCITFHIPRGDLQGDGRAGQAYIYACMGDLLTAHRFCKTQAELIAVRCFQKLIQCVSCLKFFRVSVGTKRSDMRKQACCISSLE